MVRFVQKRWVKPTSVKRHTRKIHGKTVRIKPYTRKIKRVQYGYKRRKNISNKEYRTDITLRRKIPNRQLPNSDYDRDRVRNYDDCYPFDKNRQGLSHEIAEEPDPYHVFDETGKFPVHEKVTLKEAKIRIVKLNKASGLDGIPIYSIYDAGISRDKVYLMLAKGYIYESKRDHFKLL